MSTLKVRPSSVSGIARVPGNKSISHRALMLGAIARGKTRIRSLGPGDDVRATVRCLQSYGVSIETTGDETHVHSDGIDAWTAPDGTLDCANSGTTVRTMAGLAARRAFTSTFDRRCPSVVTIRTVSPSHSNSAEFRCAAGAPGRS